jgi:hypothetical protein
LFNCLFVLLLQKKYLGDWQGRNSVNRCDLIFPEVISPRYQTMSHEPFANGG